MEETRTFFGNKNNRIIGAIALITAAIAFSAYAVYTFKQAEYIGGYAGPVTITVEGEGEVTGTPDIGTFSFLVMASNQDSTLAQNEVNEASKEIIAYLKGQGVEAKDIKSESYNLNLKYRYEENGCLSEGYCGNQVEDGFEVSQNITVKVRDIAKTGTIVAGVGSKGATGISSLSFTIDDTDALKGEARSRAIADAKAKAKVLARDLDSRLGKMVSFSEGGSYPQPYYDSRMEVSMSKDAGLVADEAVLPLGETTIKITVNIAYQLR